MIWKLGRNYEEALNLLKSLRKFWRILFKKAHRKYKKLSKKTKKLQNFKISSAINGHSSFPIHKRCLQTSHVFYSIVITSFVLIRFSFCRGQIVNVQLDVTRGKDISMGSQMLTWKNFSQYELGNNSWNSKYFQI